MRWVWMRRTTRRRRRSRSASLSTLCLLSMASWAVAPPAMGQSLQFRGDASHRGVVETRGVERLGGVLWRFQTEGTVRSTPALADGVVYVGSSDGHLYALDAESGRMVWSFDAGSPIASSPAVADDVILVGGRDGVLHGISRSSGRGLWRISTGPDRPLPWGHEGWDYIHSSPSLAQGMAYWGSGEGTLYALDPATGRVHWRYEVESRIRSTPAVVGDLLVFGDSDGYVHALEPRTGEERWRFATDGVGYDSGDFGYDRRQISASPVISGEEVLIGSRDATLYSLASADGSLRWRFDEGSAWVIASVAATESRVFSARSSSGNVRAIDRATGEEVWRLSTGDFVFSSPVLVDDVLYIGRGDGVVSAHDADTGETLWSYRTGGSIYGTPVVDDGRLFVGSDDGAAYALVAADDTWRRAVYYDEELAHRSVLGRAPAHAATRDYFVDQGYEHLDASDLVAFLEERIQDGIVSVVILGMDGLAPEVTEGPDPLLRRYLDSGGKVVSMGYLPGQLVHDEEGSLTGLDRERPGAILDIDLSAFDGDRHTVTPTELGRAWGLDGWWVGTGQTLPSRVDHVLALDERGRAVAWVKEYGGPPGTGLVSTRPTWHRTHLAQIQRVAEHGLATGRSR